MKMLEQEALFGIKLKEKVVKRKGVIEINLLDNKENPFAVDFSGHNEGSGSPCKDEEVDDCVKSLTEQHKEKYNLKIIDKRKVDIKLKEEKPLDEKIKELSSELKELLKKKYGFEVKIIIEKGVKNE